MRSLAEEQRSEFYSTMKTELERLDHLISQLLEVKRLDALGMESDPEDILLEPLIRHCARVECNRRQFEVEQIFEFDIEPAVIHTRRILLERERRKTGTGLGLYIVRPLVHLLGGKVTVHDRLDQPGSVFAIDLPGRAET